VALGNRGKPGAATGTPGHPATFPAGGAAVGRRLVDKFAGGGDTAPADASGVLEWLSSVVPAGQQWEVERISISTTSGAPTTAFVYVGDPVPRNLVDGSSSGNLDVADETQPIVVPGGQRLRIRWTGASLGAVGSARVQIAAFAAGT
jgi:hypothetical protein